MQNFLLYHYPILTSWVVLLWVYQITKSNCLQNDKWKKEPFEPTQSAFSSGFLRKISLSYRQDGKLVASLTCPLTKNKLSSENEPDDLIKSISNVSVNQTRCWKACATTPLTFEIAKCMTANLRNWGKYTKNTESSFVCKLLSYMVNSCNPHEIIS
jgi:hypothetical protein